MATTQSQRAALYTKLAESMGNEAADTLIAELPPGGWEQMATKEDLAGVESRLTNAITAGLAELTVKITEGLAETNNKLTEGLAETNVKLTEGLAAAAEERANIIKSHADLIKSQARQLYVIVTTIVTTVAVAAVSIWIALFTSAGA
ncbi:MAG: hypothetical protein OXC06_00105 [Acidimicrobiaceae bacterium]|nr:hypothetical protein [Acidimicrobiaceae bacterium]